MLLRSFESFEKIENGYLIHGDAADVKLVFNPLKRSKTATSSTAMPPM